MIDFRPAAVADKNLIRNAAFAGKTRMSSFSFGILFGWQDAYDPQIAEYNGMLLCHVGKKKTWYSWPMGDGDVISALDAMKQDAEERGRPFRLCHVPEDALDTLREYFGGKVEFSYSAGFSDYVYSAEKLVKLSGHKYHGKKNHLNRFKAENIWSFEPIIEENIELCREVAEKWFTQSPDLSVGDFEDEITAIRKCLDNFFEMGLDGGILKTQDGPVAFTMGELLSEDTFVSHFEKALYSVNGAYAAINQQFAVHITEKYPNVVYINREEDMDIESLRKAKLSYRPEFLVHKYTAVPK